MEGIGIVERAFQLAPHCASLEDVRRALKGEGYANVDMYLGGRSIRAELRQLLKR